MSHGRILLKCKDFKIHLRRVLHLPSFPSTSGVLGLQVCAATPSHDLCPPLDTSDVGSVPAGLAPLHISTCASLLPHPLIVPEEDRAESVGQAYPLDGL